MSNDLRENIVATESIDTPLLKIGGVDKTSALSATTGTNTGDNAPNTNANAYADAKVANNLTSSTTVAPAKDAVISALSAKEATANKDASGGYVGLTLFGINFKNALGTIVSLFKNTNTAIRNYTFPDRDGNIADDTDLTTILNAAKAYADALVTGMWKDRGNYDASGNTYPASGGSGTAGAILKGDIWTINVAGVLNSKNVEIGDTVRALVDTPAQTDANWAVGETNIGYVAENSANKNASGGYAGLSAFKIVMRNAANTISSYFTNTNTISRTYTLQDRDGTIADDIDLATKVGKTNDETITGKKVFDAPNGYDDLRAGDFISLLGSSTPTLIFNAYLDAGTWKYKSTNFACLIQFANSTGTLKVYTAPSGTIDTAITWTEVSSTAQSGNLDLTGILSLLTGQLKFPATENPSSDANTLDDYEEGTFTATIQFGGSDTGNSYTRQTLWYRKIGRLVTIGGNIILATKGSATGFVTISGLPFTVLTGAENGSGVAIGYIGLITFEGQMSGFFDPNTTNIRLYKTTEAGTTNRLDDTNFTNGSDIRIGGSYTI